MKTCLICGKDFKPRMKKQKYCSPKCSRRSLILKAQKLRLQTRPKVFICAYCGKEFYLKPHQYKRKFCSKKCANKNSRINKDIKISKEKKYKPAVTAEAAAKLSAIKKIADPHFNLGG